MPARQTSEPQALTPSPARAVRAPAATVRLSWLAGLCVLALPLLPAAAAEQNAYRVAPGDRIGITVFGQADMSGDTMIDSSYSIAVPLVGSVSVRGLTLREIEQRVAKSLADGYLQNPVVSVRLTEPRPIYVVGDVLACPLKSGPR